VHIPGDVRRGVLAHDPVVTTDLQAGRTRRSREDTIRAGYAALNRGDLDGFAAMLDPQVITVDPHLGNPVGRAAALAAHRARRLAFPDIHHAVEEVIDSGERSVALITASGTHTGRLGRHPATERVFRLAVCEVAEWRGDVAVSVQTFCDQLHLLQQLGLA
jgi:ketosteroid isomerase-like protein